MEVRNKNTADACIYFKITCIYIYIYIKLNKKNHLFFVKAKNLNNSVIKYTLHNNDIEYFVWPRHFPITTHTNALNVLYVE